MPEGQTDQPESPPLRRSQFGLRHLFVLTTLVMIPCALGAGVGWANALVMTATLSAPAVTLIHLTWTRGKRPGLSLLLATAIPTILFGLFGGSSLAWMTADLGLQLNGPGTPLLALLATGVGFALMGALHGILTSIPFLALWYLVRGLACHLRSHQSA